MSSDAAITDDALEEEEGDFGDWVEDEGEISEQRKTKCLFSKRVYANAHEALTRAATDFGFDLRRVVLNTNNNAENETTSNSITKDGNEDDENELEFYDVIKVINFVRKMVLEETKNNSKNNNNKNKESDEKEYDEKELAKRVIARVNDGAWKDDVYLMPVDASGSDPLTYEWESYVYGIDDDEERAPAATKEEKANKDERDSTSQNEHSASSLMISSLRSENEALKLKVFEMMEKLGMISEEEEKQKLAPVANVGERIVVSSAPTRNMNDDCASRRYANDDSDRFDKRTQQEKDEDEADARVRDSDDSYFNSYSYFSQDHYAGVWLGNARTEADAHDAVADAILSMRLFGAYTSVQHDPAAVAAMAAKVIAVKPKPSFAVLNPTFEGCCMGNRKTCKCGAPFFS